MTATIAVDASKLPKESHIRGMLLDRVTLGLCYRECRFLLASRSIVLRIE
jgi:hypothetical protein